MKSESGGEEKMKSRRVKKILKKKKGYMKRRWFIEVKKKLKNV